MTKRNLSDLLRQEVSKDETGEAPSQPQDSSKSNGQARQNKPASTQLESQVKELKAALAQAAEQEQQMQDQIKSLQAEVKQKDKQIAESKADGAKGEKLQQELAEAKEVILQLSAANTQMSTTLDELKNPPPSQLQRQKQAQPQPQRQPVESIQRRAAISSLSPIRHHSIQHGPAPKPSKSVDVGWMD
jgi:chromosome segregation ATPase